MQKHFCIIAYCFYISYAINKEFTSSILARFKFSNKFSNPFFLVPEKVVASISEPFINRALAQQRRRTD